MCITKIRGQKRRARERGKNIIWSQQTIARQSPNDEIKTQSERIHIKRKIIRKRRRKDLSLHLILFSLFSFVTKMESKIISKKYFCRIYSLSFKVLKILRFDVLKWWYNLINVFKIKRYVDLFFRWCIF